ncbi:MAG: hypothetical protein ACYDBB_26285 [Armatimonadota bacterium]
MTAIEQGITYRLADHQGRLVIEGSDGRVLPWTCFGDSSERDIAMWKQKVQSFLAAGSHLYQISFWRTEDCTCGNPFFAPDGTPVDAPPHAGKVDEQVTWLLEQDPEAHVLIRFGHQPTAEWRKQNLDHFQPTDRYPNGDGYSQLPSLASDPFRERVVQLIHDAVRWCEAKPWRDRVIGYTFFPFCEGGTEIGVYGEIFDTSVVMQQTFRAFLREKYASDAELSAAWQEEVTLDTAAVPTKAEWLAKRDRLHLLHWPDPALVQRERDYFLLQKQLCHRFWGDVFTAMLDATSARPVIKGYDILKQHQQGWLHDPDFEALWEPGVMDSYGSALLATGSIGMGPLLDHPGIDMLQTPGMYYNRAMGYSWEAEGLTDSLVLRGKLNFAEGDMRTWVYKDWSGTPYPAGTPIPDAGTFMNEPEMQAGFDRALGWAFSRNQMFYFFSVCGGNWWYDDPAISQHIGREHRVVEASTRMPWKDTTDAVCFVVDDESPFYEDFSSGYQYLSIFRQMEDGLALSGVPYRVHLLSDLARENFPDYKCYYFPNLFKVDAAVEAILRAKVLRNGHVAIFGPATGITDGETLSADGATRLLGVPMELLPKRCARRIIYQDHGHPISRRLPTTAYGDTYAYGPTLVPAMQRIPADDPALKSLGAAFYYYFNDRPGPFVHDFGNGGCGSEQAGTRGVEDYAVVFMPSVPLSAEFLRECARYAGCHIWTEQNAVIYASEGFVGLHTAHSGPHTLCLPGKVDVLDMMRGEYLAKGVDSITLNVSAPATYLLRLE